MAKITIEELSDSLKEYLNGLGLTEAQVQELINKFEDEKLGDIGQLLTVNKSNLVEAINDIYNSQNNIKQELVAALVTKGIEATTNMSFNELISEIDNIQIGIEPTGTAVAGDVLSGKTFINSTGQTLTGTMTNRGGARTITPGTSNIVLNAGYYSGIVTINGSSTLRSEYIRSGVTIFGVTGTV